MFWETDPAGGAEPVQGGLMEDRSQGLLANSPFYVLFHLFYFTPA